MLARRWAYILRTVGNKASLPQQDVPHRFQGLIGGRFIVIYRQSLRNVHYVSKEVLLGEAEEGIEQLSTRPSCACSLRKQPLITNRLLPPHLRVADFCARIVFVVVSRIADIGSRHVIAQLRPLNERKAIALLCITLCNIYTRPSMLLPSSTWQVYVNERNILEWHFLLEGPPGTPYEGGWYIGRLKFPANYPFEPPAIMMVTPSGRFKTGTRLCLSMSDFHPGELMAAASLSRVL